MISLSRRELEVVELVGRGMRYQEAADALGLSLDAVRSRLGRAYSKLGAQNCRDAARMLKRNKRVYGFAAEQAPTLFLDEGSTAT